MATTCSHKVIISSDKSGGWALAFQNKTNPSRSQCHFTTTTTRTAGSGMSNLHMVASLSGAPTSVPVRVAHELLLAGHLYLDVRTEEEFKAGHVNGAVNVPYLVRVGSGMAKNTNFIAQVWSQFDKDEEILIGCQGGNTSLMAATHLLSAGYTGIVDISGGFNAWIQSRLPIQL